jgi:hypothetical protein
MANSANNASLGDQIQVSLVMVHLVELDDCQFLQQKPALAEPSRASPMSVPLAELAVHSPFHDFKSNTLEAE